MYAALRGQWGPAAVVVVVGLFLFVFLVVPVVNVIYVAFQDPNTGALTLINFVDFFRTSLFQESSVNSLYVAVMSVVASSCFALPLAYFTTRFNFGGAMLIQTLGVVPLIMPPFVGAVAMLLLLGENGSVNLLLDEWFGFTIPFMEGLNGVILVESIHYFPFILINLSAALNNIDRSMEESAQNLGASGMRLFRRIVFPLAMPGYVAGASLVFRPQDVSIAVPDGAVAAAAFTGRVQHREFLGNLLRYTVAVGDNALVVDDPHQSGRRVFAAGDQVTVTLDVNHIRVLTD